MTLSRLSTSSVYNVQVNNGLLGAGGWASVTATTGSPTTGTYTDANGVEWRYWQWNSSGSVTTTAGVVDVLLVGGGSGYIPAWGGGGDLDEQPGGGGDVQMGLYSVASGAKTVTVGAGAAASAYPWGGPGQASSLGSITTRSGRLYGMDTNGLAAGVTSSITGTSITYSLGGATGEPSRAPGCGGSTSNRTGSNGVVVVRVPTNPGLTVPQQPQGLAGVGNWAYVTATTGSPSTGTYTDANGVGWKYYQWSGSGSSPVTGSVTFTSGVVDAFVVGGGNHHASLTPQGGGVNQGVTAVTSGTFTVTAGVNGVSTVRSPTSSSLGSFRVAAAASNTFDGTGAGYWVGGATSDGITSSVTGASSTYARGNFTGTPNFGDGIRGGSGGGYGTVIVRVPSQFALA